MTRNKRTEFYRGKMKIDWHKCRAEVALGGGRSIQCWRDPIFKNPMAMPVGQRSPYDDRLNLCQGHYEDYDGWPGPNTEALKAFSYPQSDVVVEALNEDIKVYFPEKDGTWEKDKAQYEPNKISNWAAPFLAKKAALAAQQVEIAEEN